MPGFFSASELPVTKQPPTLVPRCGACGLYKLCRSPKMPVWGEGRRKILIVGEAPGCITGDSLIDTAYRDKSKHPDGLPIKDLVGKSGVCVYSFDVEKQRLVIGKVKRVWWTGRKKVYRVTYEWSYAKGRKKVILRNSIDVTSNHRFLLKRWIAHDPFVGLGREQDYLSIDQGLAVGDSIQPFHRRNFEYSSVGAFSNKMISEARLLLSYKIGRKLKDDEECHHRDENKLNDRGTNLELHTGASHARLHTIKRNPMHNPKHRKRHRIVMSSIRYREGMQKKMREVLSDPRVYQERLRQIQKAKGKISETLKQRYKEPEFYYRYLLSRKKAFGWSDDQVRSVFRKKFPNSPLPIVDNHRIVSIEYLGVRDVYDMETYHYHNFAVNGVFVHNSQEDDQGRPFAESAPAGRELRDALGPCGVDLKRDCWVTNAIRCHPDKDKLPPKAVDHCRPLLLRALEELKPETVILLGSAAVKSLIGWIWRGDPGGVSLWAGWKIPCQRLNAWVCPTFHPAGVLHAEGENVARGGVLRLFFRRHLKAAFRKRGRPFDKVPDFRGQVRVEYDDGVVGNILCLFREKGRPVSFDFETDRLKPDTDGSRIVCCSVSDGEITVAYPWLHNTAVDTEYLLRSDVPKIGWNVKFESRWARKVLGVRVRNWVWDGMLAAHALDNRQGSKGLKFQAFVNLGQESYDEQIKPYLYAEGGNTPNRIKDVSLPKLLEYCALDSLLEHKIAMIQAKKLGISL